MVVVELIFQVGGGGVDIAVVVVELMAAVELAFQVVVELIVVVELAVQWGWWWW